MYIFCQLGILYCLCCFTQNGFSVLWHPWGTGISLPNVRLLSSLNASVKAPNSVNTFTCIHTHKLNGNSIDSNRQTHSLKNRFTRIYNNIIQTFSILHVTVRCRSRHTVLAIYRYRASTGRTWNKYDELNIKMEQTSTVKCTNAALTILTYV